MDLESRAGAEIECGALMYSTGLIDAKLVRWNAGDFAVILRDINGAARGPNSPGLSQIID